MRYLLLISFLTFSACTNGTNTTAFQEELNSTKQALLVAQEKIAQLETQIEPEGDLVHLVFLTIKPETDQAALIAEVKKLEGIREVMDLEIGPFENLGDDRALSNYSLLMQMSFANQAAYETYQKHPIHLGLKKKLGIYLAGPPATYDFIKK